MADFCLGCGRALKNKTSIQRGYGPDCYKKKQDAIKKENQDEEIELVNNKGLDEEEN